jgi:hypothetical protein
MKYATFLKNYCACLVVGIGWLLVWRLLGVFRLLSCIPVILICELDYLYLCCDLVLLSGDIY